MPEKGHPEGRLRRYDPDAVDGAAYTAANNRSYSRAARIYDLAVKIIPLWGRWIGQVIPHIQGPRVLELSCGTGWLLSQYAARYQTSAVDLNERMVQVSRSNLLASGITAAIQQADVEALPYKDASFDSIVNTMAFTGYPHATEAMSEIRRVLRPGGRLLVVDINYPTRDSWLGWRMVRMWAALGDIIRDLDSLLGDFGYSFERREVGGFGSVHLYVATKLVQKTR